jgi:hypothetical protein
MEGFRKLGERLLEKNRGRKVVVKRESNFVRLDVSEPGEEDRGTGKKRCCGK